MDTELLIEIFVCFILPAIIVVGIFIVDQIKQKEQKDRVEEIYKEKIEEYGIKITKQFPVSPNEIFIIDDDNKNFVYVQKIVSNEPVIIIKRFEYSKLIDFNLFEDGEQQIQGRGIASAIGGLAFGTAGAIVGSSGGRNIKNICTELVIKIHINDLETPLLTINLLPIKCSKNSLIYKLARKLADEIIALLSYIEANK